MTIGNNNDKFADKAPVERHELFDVSGPINLEAKSASGSITVVVGRGDVCEMLATARGHNALDRLSSMDVRFEQASQSLIVSTRPKGSPRNWLFDLGRNDVDLVITVPESSSLRLSTASGDVRGTGRFGDVRVSSASGNVKMGDIASLCQVNLASGDVEVAECFGPSNIKTASGDITVGRAHDDAKLHSVSGDLDVLISDDLDATLNTVSGDVLVRLERGLRVDVNASSLSGKLRSDIDLSGSSGESTDDGVVRIQASTVSGDVKLQRA